MMILGREKENIFLNYYWNLTWVCKHKSRLFAILIMPVIKICAHFAKIIHVNNGAEFLFYPFSSKEHEEKIKNLVKINIFGISMSFFHCVRNSMHNLARRNSLISCKKIFENLHANKKKDLSLKSSIGNHIMIKKKKEWRSCVTSRLYSNFSSRWIFSLSFHPPVFDAIFNVNLLPIFFLYRQLYELWCYLGSSLCDFVVAIFLWIFKRHSHIYLAFITAFMLGTITFLLNSQRMCYRLFESISIQLITLFAPNLHLLSWHINFVYDNKIIFKN